MNRGILLALLVTLVAGPDTVPWALAQSPAPAGSESDWVRYRDPRTGSEFTVTDAERRRRLKFIDETIAELRDGQKLYLEGSEGATILETRKLDRAALWLVQNGRLTPGEIPAWKERTLARGRDALEKFRAERAALTAAVTVRPPAPPGADPAAADDTSWTTARGEVLGTFAAACQDFKVAGVVRLRLAGDGSVGGMFDDFPNRRYVVTGSIAADGTASGTASAGVPDAPTIEWSATLSGSADKPALKTSSVSLVPPRTTFLVGCEPGQISVTAPAQDADPSVTTTWFPDPMDWRAVRGRIGLDGIMDCWNASGSLPRINSRWSFTLVGDGSVRGTVQTVKGDFNVQQLSAPTSFQAKVEEYRLTSGSPVEGGFIRATARLPEGEYTFTVPLRRSQVDRNKIEVHSGWSGTGLGLGLQPGEGTSCQGSPMGQWE